MVSQIALSAYWTQRGLPFATSSVIITIYRISRRSHRAESVQFRNHRIASVLFAHDAVLLVSSSQNLQCALGWFAENQHTRNKKEKKL